MKLAAALAATITLALLTSCGSTGGTSIVPPVIAQSGYSNASITGTYSFLLNKSGNVAALGTFVADGAGKITSGTVNIGTSSSGCSGTVTGNYSLSSTASGTASFIFTITSGASVCTTNGWFIPSALAFNIEAGSSGANLLLASSSDPNTQGTAVKQ
jgi:hypothetical protein